MGICVSRMSQLSPFTFSLWNRNWIAAKRLNRLLQTIDGTLHWYVEEPVSTSNFFNLFLCTWAKSYVAINVQSRSTLWSRIYYSILKLMIAIHHIIIKESSFITSEFIDFEWTVFFGSNRCKCCKIHDLAFGFSPECEKVESENFPVGFSYLLPTCQDILVEDLSPNYIF